MKDTRMARFFSLSGDGYHVDCTQLAAVLGIGLSFEGHFLTFLQRTEALRLNRGEVNEHIVTPVIVRDKAVAFPVVEPPYGSVHIPYLLSARSKRTHLPHRCVTSHAIHAIFIIRLLFYNVKTRLRNYHYFFKKFCINWLLVATNFSNSSGFRGR